MTRLPVTKDKRRQRRIVAAAQRQSDELGIAVHYSFNADGVMLIDGQTQDEIDERHERIMSQFLKENERYLDPGGMGITILYKDEQPAPITEIPAPIGPQLYHPHPVVMKFEPKTKHKRTES
jgi:hypothetical protein